MTALTEWGEALRAWAIPDEILSAAPESPWAFPIGLFRDRASSATDEPPSPSSRHALEALSEGGSVLDVGSGAGAASLALVPPAGSIVAVDPSTEMLEAFEELAAGRQVPHRTMQGGWPDIAASVEPSDVVVCHHVVYNVQDLEPFVRELCTHARRRVVVELTAEHPRAWMNDLWMRFHGLERPTRPTSDDLVAALGEIGVTPAREDWSVPREAFTSREEAVALARARLCLTEDRDEEVADALGDRLRERDDGWTLGPEEQPLSTLWWDGQSERRRAT
jgi:SAM-dependent methyltransferase